MSQRTVQLVVGKILTDEEFRSDFLEQPIETLRSLQDIGFELTRVEVDALVGTDRRFWAVGAEWIDARLQGCRLSRARPKSQKKWLAVPFQSRRAR